MPKRTSKHAEHVRECFSLACRQEGVTRRECAALHDGAQLDWEGRLAKHARAHGYKFKVSKRGGHPVYKARPGRAALLRLRIDMLEHDLARLQKSVDGLKDRLAQLAESAGHEFLVELKK